MITLLATPLVIFIDRLLGEPTRFHPLIGFGSLANNIEKRLNCGNYFFWKGMFSWMIAVIPITFCIYLIDQLVGGIWLTLLCGWLAIGWKSLRQHGLAVFNALKNNDIEQARTKTSYLVSRDTSQLDETALSRATIESILENGSDAVIAPLFWLIIFGAPGVVFYRLCNTLDAMWGYHNQRFEYFGKFTARVDDVLNYIPARITALLYTLCGNSKKAWTAWKTQGVNWYSPNAGVVMASGAGALNIKLGGAAIYNGSEKPRPQLGYEKPPMNSDIKRAIQLLDYAVYAMAIISAIVYIISLFFVKN